MDRMILPLFGALFLLVLGAIGPIAWDRHPPLGWHHRVLFWTVGFSLPDSLATQRDKARAQVSAAARDLAQCHANGLTLQSAVEAQNAAVEALGRAGAARVAQSAQAASAARAVAEYYRTQAQEILDARAESPDACDAADRLILQEAGR